MISDPARSSNLGRIGVFYDGNFFFHISTYYRYGHPRERRLSIGGLHDFICHKAAEELALPQGRCVVTEAHHFCGRERVGNLSGAEGTERLLKGRIFDDVLMSEGITSHCLPLVMGPTGRAEKGVDVLLALEAYDLAVRGRYDLCALIAGDGDFVPLVRKLQATGIPVMSLGWELNYQDQMGREHQTFTSQRLQAEAVCALQMHELIGEEAEHEDERINALFVPDHAEDSWSEQEQPFATATNEARVSGRICNLKPEGYGFIEPKLGGENIFFHQSALMESDFRDLAAGDLVEYRPGTNERGPCALAIQVVERASGF